MITSAMRLFAIAWAPFVFAHLLLFGCVTGRNLNWALSDQSSPRLGHEFVLKAGQELKLEGADLQVKFVSVEGDSRCPADVNCIWAGKADVVLDVMHNKCNTPLTLSTPESSQAGDQGKIGNFRLKLIKLDPYPRSDQKISPSDYRATLIVTKE